MDDLAWLDATAQAELVRAGEASPGELVEAAIARVEKLNPQLNAVIHPRFEKAISEADSASGPFAGVPIVLKDLVAHSAGDPFHCGMRFLRDLGWTEDSDSYTVQRLRRAGFVIVGRTNTPELGLNPTTEPEAYGPTPNPWNLERSCGGSSGGSAVAVATGMVPAGHATDGGGSIRIPASECGLVGLKPSRGRVSEGPRAGENMAGLSTQNAVARTIRDAAAVLDVLAGPMPGDPYTAPPPTRPYADEVLAEPPPLRIGLRTAAPMGTIDTHPECAAAAADAARRLESLGHEVRESGPPALDEPEFPIHFGILTGADAAAALDDIAARTGTPIKAPDVEPATWHIAELGRNTSAAQLVTSREWLTGYGRRVASWFEDFDLLLTPTLTVLPPPLGHLSGTPDNPLAGGLRAGALSLFTMPFNATGQPAISLPLGTSAEGLPVGVQVVAPYGREDLLIRVAAQLERAASWANRRPAVSV